MENFKLITNELRKNSIILNKKLNNKIGLINNLILSLLIQRRQKYKENYFTYPIDDLINDSTLSRSRQAKAVNNLKELNLITLDKKGTPCYRYFSLNYDEIIKLLEV